MKIDEYIKLINEFMRIGKKIEEAIESETDRKKRKALKKAYKNRDSRILRQLWFDN